MKEKIEGNKKEKGDYFLAKGIRLSIADLNAFAACIDEIFVQTEYISKIIVWVNFLFSPPRKEPPDIPPFRGRTVGLFEHKIIIGLYIEAAFRLGYFDRPIPVGP